MGTTTTAMNASLGTHEVCPLFQSQEAFGQLPVQLLLPAG
jgi:hypothetical protein